MYTKTPLILAMAAYLTFAAIHFTARADVPVGKSQGTGVLKSMLAGPLEDCDEIVFANRVSGSDHWYVNFGYYCNAPQRAGYGEGGQLCRLNLRTRKLQLLIDDPKGGVRDPQVHYDGQKILFSYRKGDSKTFHLYEIDIDGSNLRQLTDGPDDDIEPTYLPDDSIIFCSSRCQRVVNCWISRVATLYRCDADGQNIRMISSNNDHDNTPWVLPDGRVLYMRWEYVDRSQVHFHHLWTVNPDGTGQMVWYGNELGGVAMLDAKPIPGSNKVVASFSPGHGRAEHMGYVTIVDPGAGPDVQTTVQQVSKSQEMFRDPFAISENCFLVANDQGILVMDGQGNAELVYKTPEGTAGLMCHEPRLLTKRMREPIISTRTDLADNTGKVVLADIYHGRSMSGVERGEIKKLLVLEQLPKPVNFSGGQDPLSIGGTFTMARILGTVPVEPDGSAYMQLPAMRSLFFVALDKNDLSVQRMQSFVTLQPGEILSCVGCHEQRSHTPLHHSELMALSRMPSQVESIDDVPNVLDFPRDIQPILDAHCVECHNPDRWEGRVDLTADHTPVYSISYWTMVKHGLIADGRNKPYSQQAPRSIGSSASRLMDYLDGSHHNVRLSALEQKTIRLWIETSATYPGTYAALGSGVYPVELPLATLQKRCDNCHSVNQIENPHIHYTDFHVHFGPKDGGVPDYLASAEWQHPIVPQSRCNLTRPEKSLLLRAPLSVAAGGLGLCDGEVFADTNDPDYQTLLQTITTASEQLQQGKRFDMPGFRPNQHYIREMQRFGALRADLERNEPVDIYQADENYWRSFWYRVELKNSTEP